jgi:hypothetical protein
MLLPLYPTKTPTVILIPATVLVVVAKQIFQLFLPESNPGSGLSSTTHILFTIRDRLNKVATHVA